VSAPVTATSIRRDLKALLAWWLGVAALVAVTVAFYPTVADNEELDELWEDLPESLQVLFGATDLTSPVGYLQSQLFAATLPVVLLVWAIGRANAAVAREEREHTLDLVLSAPISRRSFGLQKVLAIAALLAALLTAVLLPIVTLAPIVDLDIGAGKLVAGTMQLGLLLFFFAGLTYAVSSALGRQGVAVGVTAAVATSAYLLDSLGKLVDWLDPLRVLSPFYWYTGGDPLGNGPDWRGASALLVAAALLVGLGTLAFERRDLSA
jgi:ABC-2 type transport system permease protein